MNLPFVDIKASYNELRKEFDNAYRSFMESGWYVLGPEVEKFEENYAEYTGSKYCVGVSSGLDALCLSLEAGGVNVGDEVLVPANTYIATWLSISQVGALPVPIEPDEGTFNIDPSRIEEKITSKTKAIMVVHLYGAPVDMDPILDIASRYNLLIFEDNAQAQGAIYKGRKTGNLGYVAATSFYPTKNLGAFGEAGCVTTNIDEVADKVRLLRNYGSRKKYFNEIKGYNHRIDALQASFLNIKLNKLDEWNRRRRRIAEIYSKGLDPSIIPKSDLNNSVWHQYVIRHKKRDILQQELSKRGIPTMVHYPIPPHLSDAYSEFGFQCGDFPITEKIANTCLSLPIGPHLKENDCVWIIDNINDIINKII